MSHCINVSLPVDGPLDREAFFARREPAKGLPTVPRMAFGAAWISEASIPALHAAWSGGFLLTDTSPLYGESETIVGKALASWRGDDPIIATKCGVEAGREHIDYSPAGVDQFISRSRRRFGRDFDLLAAHEPEHCADDDIKACAEHLQQLRDGGQVKAIGLGGPGQLCETWLAHASFDYVLTYLRISAATLQGLTDEVPAIQRHGAQVFAASPTCFGLLTGAFDQVREQRKQWMPMRVFASRAEKLHQLAADAGMSISHLALRFLLSVPAVDFMVCGAADEPQWADCAAAYDAGPLSADLYAKVWHSAQQGTEPYCGG
jgi:aryl-alcohol dehydrogenase-like predicted oxidoreductase